MITPRTFTGGMAMTNGYLHESTAGTLLIDAPAGCAGWLRQLEVKPAALLLTHQHYDHVEDVAAVVAWAGCPVFSHAGYDAALTLETLLESVGMKVTIPRYSVDHLLAGKSSLPIAGVDCRIAHVPGHAADSITLYFPDDGLVFSGDTLFAGGVGRTDLPGGSWQVLLAGIRRELFSLPPETRVFPGHGEPTTIGAEIHGNPFLT